MNFTKKIVIGFFSTPMAFSINYLSTHNQSNNIENNLNAIIETGEKVSSHAVILRSEEGPGAGLLLQFFMLMAYVKPMAEATKKYYDLAQQEEPSIICKNCSKMPMGAGTFFNSLTATALNDLAMGKNNFDQMKKILDESLEIVKNGSFEEVRNFMLITAEDIKFFCPHCKGYDWYKMPMLNK